MGSAFRALYLRGYCRWSLYPTAQTFSAVVHCIRDMQCVHGVACAVQICVGMHAMQAASLLLETLLLWVSRWSTLHLHLPPSLEPLTFCVYGAH